MWVRPQRAQGTRFPAFRALHIAASALSSTLTFAEEVAEEAEEPNRVTSLINMKGKLSPGRPFSGEVK